MSRKKRKIRDQFRNGVFQRDRFTCVVCPLEAVDAHHIRPRENFPDGGYHLSNGISLCSGHHLKAEAYLKGISDDPRFSPIRFVVIARRNSLIRLRESSTRFFMREEEEELNELQKFLTHNTCRNTGCTGHLSKNENEIYCPNCGEFLLKVSHDWKYMNKYLLDQSQ